MPFDAVLCDLDGVLRRWPPMADLERAHGVPPGTVAAVAFAPLRLHPAITGACTDEEWRAAVTEDLAAHTDRAAEHTAAWSATAGEIDHEVAEILRAARRHGPVVIVTNATTRLESDLDRLGLTEHAVVSSARVGAAKPDPRIYRAAAERAGTPPDRCLFVDDSATNTEAAGRLGMTAHHFTTVQALRDLITSRGW
jgi:putative hydrolase of the HAD superfamily